MNLVLAGTQKEYHDFCAERKGKFRQIRNYSDLRGLMDLTIYLVGTYRYLPDYSDIMEYLNYAGFKIKRA